MKITTDCIDLPRPIATTPSPESSLLASGARHRDSFESTASSPVSGPLESPRGAYGSVNPEHKNPSLAVTGTQPTSDWSPVKSINSLQYPQALDGATPVTDRLPFGQQVTATIGNEVVHGQLEGWDYKGRPKIRTSMGFRFASWDTVTPDGPVRSVPTCRTTEGLNPKSIMSPPPRLQEALQQAIAQRVTGKHTAEEYKEALAKEGYPMYLVGGAIRDAIYLLKEEPQATNEDIIALMKDIDIVTTAPPHVLRRIASEVAPEYSGAVFSPPIVDQFGCVLVGGPKAGLKDCAGIDLVSIRKGPTDTRPVYHTDTNENALPTTLGYRLIDDVTGRDFACNALYYDPLNEVIIDPIGHGIADAQNRMLRVNVSGGKVESDKIFRFYKFKLRGYHSDAHNQALIKRAAEKCLPRESKRRLISNFCRIAPKHLSTREDAREFLQRLQEAMALDGNEAIYTQFVEPIEKEILTTIAERKTAPEETSDWWHYLAAGASIGAIGLLAHHYASPDLAEKIEETVKSTSKRVQDTVNEYGNRFSNWTGWQIPKLSLVRSPSR